MAVSAAAGIRSDASFVRFLELQGWKTKIEKQTQGRFFATVKPEFFLRPWVGAGVLQHSEGFLGFTVNAGPGCFDPLKPRPYLEK